MRKKSVITYVIAFIVVTLAAYFFIAPAALSKFFPQYTLMNKYVDAKLCTDLPEGAPSDVFLPARCNTVDKSRTVACTYESSRYHPPAQATDDETTLCPLFVTQNDNRGVKNVAIAMLPTSKDMMRDSITGVLIVSLAVTYSAILVLRHWLRSRRTA